MKKNLLIFGLIAATAVVFSCSKEPVQVEPAVTPAEETEEPTPVTPAVDGNLLTSFGVTFEGDTKVTVDIDNGETAIEDGDEVLVVVGSNSAVYVYDETDEKFYLKDGETAVTLNDTAQVFYPEDEFEVSGSNVLFTMPNGVEADGETFGEINPMAGVLTGEAGNYSVELGNVASVLRVKVDADEDKEIASVTLTYGAYYAVGSKYYVTLDPDAALLKDKIKMEFSSDNSDSMSETVTLNSTSNKADVLFLVPTIDLVDGLTVKATLKEGQTHNGGTNSFTVANPSTTARERNKISTMNFYLGLFSGGAGTSGNPYKIKKARDFKNIATYTTSGYGSINATAFRSAYYQQIFDIDLKEAPLTPIGNNASSGRFTGNYDGNGKKLQNVKIDVDSQFAAPFGYVDGYALIKDLTVTGTIAKTGTTNNSLAGGIAGILNGNAQITGCTNEATISSTATYTGGIAGRLYSSTASISNCHNKGNVVGVSDVGGIVGDLDDGIISSSENRGNVTASGMEAGGIAGKMTGSSKISSCTNKAAITNTTSESNSYAAGIVGRALNASEIVSCVNEGEINATKAFTAGIVGDMTGTVDKCVNKNSVVGGANTGGIAGALRASSTVRRCYSSKNYEINGTNRVGGIVGFQVDGTVANCFSNSNVTITSNTADYGAGGLVGILGGGLLFNSATGGDIIVKCSASCTKAADAKVNVGGLVGRQSGGTIQNVYSPLYAKDIKIGSIHGRSGSGKIGQIVGVVTTAGSLCAYYFGGCATATTGWQYWGTNEGQDNVEGQWAFTSANNVSMDWTAPVAKSFSGFGQSFTSGTYHLKDVLNINKSSGVKYSAYTPAEGEVITWSDLSASDYHPIPDELMNLGEDYYKN